MGVSGAGMSFLITSTIGALLSNYYVFIILPLPESIFFYSRKTFRNYCQYLKFIMFNGLSICFEVWAIDIFGIIAIWIGKNDYIVYVIFCNVYQLGFSFIYGIATAMVILISRNITHYFTTVIKKILFITFIIVLFFESISVLICVLCPTQIINFYISDEKRISYGKSTIMLMGLYFILDCIQFINVCIFQGLGENLIPLIMICCDYYIFQLVMVIILGKVLKQGIIGILAGMCIGHFITNLIYLILFYFYLDFKKFYEETRKRIYEDNLIAEEVEFTILSSIEGIEIEDEEEMCKLNVKYN